MAKTTKKKKVGLKRMELIVTNQAGLDKQFKQGVIYACATFVGNHGRHVGIKEVLSACGLKRKLDAMLTGAEEYDVNKLAEYLP